MRLLTRSYDITPFWNQSPDGQIGSPDAAIVKTSICFANLLPLYSNSRQICFNNENVVQVFDHATQKCAYGTMQLEELEEKLIHNAMMIVCCERLDELQRIETRKKLRGYQEVLRIYYRHNFGRNNYDRFDAAITGAFNPVNGLQNA